ncbi:MAG: glycosyltransferase [Bacilli bacterium]|jgi:hypothetical protein
MNVIVRPVFNRPEMLYLSLKYEQKAREVFDDGYITLFAVDDGSNKDCLDLIESYKFDKIVVKRSYRYKVCANVMEALRQAFNEDIKYAINIEDDLILHPRFFEFVSKAHNSVENLKYSVITTWGYSNLGDPSVLKRTSYSCGPGVVISKEFFNLFMLQFANFGYYNGWITTINKINDWNANNPIATYKKEFGNLLTHLDWDGLMRRLVDYACYKDNMFSYSSLCYRLLHIGFYGYNRHGGKFPNDLREFSDRVLFLENNIFNPDILSKLDGVYKDYSVFDHRLENWNGDLSLEC